MDFKQIQELIRLVGKNNISEISIEEENFKIKIKSANSAPVFVEPQNIIPAPVVQAIASPIIPAAEAAKTPATKGDSESKNETSAHTHYITIKSPIVGTFYRSPGPDKDPFVKAGDTVSVGTVLCIIEAMKLFNEIESEHAGTIVKILVDDATPVEFDQPLFLIDPH
ncbi:MAG: acetyl-CoA carboxylase biotin carboxyl carrier protein [Chitinophagales bacterium]